jgi:hypothetical protein
MQDNLEDFLSDVSQLTHEKLTGSPDTTNSVFERGFDLDAFQRRLANGYVIKDKRSGALLSFGLLLTRRTVQLALAKRLIDTLKKGGPVRILVLKSRKLGVSTLTDMIFAELAIQLDQWNSAIIAHTDAGAAELFQAVRLTLERMEQEKQCPEIRTNNQDMIRFGARSIDARQAKNFGHTATIQCTSAGAKYALSGQTPNALHLSECAKYDAVGGDAEQERFILSALGAVPKVGATIVVAESTANGQQGWFYNQWRAAVAGEADADGLGWTPIFIPWFKDPDCAKPIPPGYQWDRWEAEDIAREKVLVAKHGVGPEQLYFRRWMLKTEMNMNVDYWDQEYPDSWETAFIASGSGIFGRPIMERMRSLTKDEIRRSDTFHDSKHVTIREAPGGSVRIWEDPQPGAEYILGSDVADGVTFGVDAAGRKLLDSSTFSIWKRTPLQLEQVAECVCQADNFEFGRAIAAWGMHYNAALVNVERNRAQGVIAGLRVAEYPVHRMFRPPLHAATSEGLAGNYFFQKTASNSKNLMDTVFAWSRDRLIPRSASLVHELGTLRRDQRGVVDTNGRDVTIACAMAVIADAQGDPIEMQATPASQRKQEVPWNIDPGPEEAPEKQDTVNWDGETGLYDPGWN